MNRALGLVEELGWRAVALLLAAFMGVPLILVVLFSFNQSALTSLPLTGFTLDWYRKLFSLGAFWPALWNSLIVASLVAILSVVIGTMAALLLARMAPRRAEALIAIVSVPMMLPALIIGVAMMSYFVRLIDLPLGLPTVILGHLVIAQPFVILIVFSRLATFDWAIVDSARRCSRRGRGRDGHGSESPLWLKEQEDALRSRRAQGAEMSWRHFVSLTAA